MIELAIGAGLVTAGVLLARAVRRRRDDADLVPGPDPRPDRSWDDDTSGSERSLGVGDVLLYATDELWLAGAIELDEEELVCRLYRTPGGARSATAADVTWVVQLDGLSRELAIMSETETVPSGRVPDELPVGGLRLSLRRRGQASVRTVGEHLPPVRPRAEYTILAGTGGRTLVVLDFHGGDRLALVGERVGWEMLDVLPGSRG